MAISIKITNVSIANLQLYANQNALELALAHFFKFMYYEIIKIKF
jgi:hypothetical protein